MNHTIKKYINDEIKVILLDEVDSTNNYCKEIGKKEFINTLVVAKSQTGGRGRLGRSFISKKDKGIYMSLLLNPQMKLSEVSKVTCVVATSITKVLSNYIDKTLFIKWVNDIYLNDLKICGILTESKIENNQLKYLIIGIGLNLEHQVFPEDVNASSIYDEAGIQLNKEELIGKIVNQVMNDLKDINDLNHISYFKKHMYLLEESVELLLQNRKHIGIVKGINDNFELLVEVNKNLITVSSGEILKVNRL